MMSSKYFMIANTMFATAYMYLIKRYVICYMFCDVAGVL